MKMRERKPDLRKNKPDSIGATQSKVYIEGGTPIPALEEPEDTQDAEIIGLPEKIEGSQHSVQIREEEEERQLGKRAVKTRDQLRMQFASGDDPLDRHIFAEVPLKVIDFQDPKIKELLEVTTVDNKKHAYLN